MTAGYFLRTYEVWRPTNVQDPQNGYLSQVWSKVADVPGRAYIARVTDTYAAAQLVGKITWTFACAADADVRRADQIRFDDRKLTVTAVAVTSSGQRLQVLCQEVQM